MPAPQPFGVVRLLWMTCAVFRADSLFGTTRTDLFGSALRMVFLSLSAVAWMRWVVF